MELSKPILQAYDRWDLGLVDYETALQAQLDTVENLENKWGRIIFCSHPPVVTTGRAFEPSEISDWKGKVVEVSRGGKATYHGPSQLVIYPIIDLKFNFSKDLHRYLRFLESITVKTLKSFAIDAVTKDHSDLNRTGVWVENHKVASIGIAVKNWVAYHGIAINVDQDETAFAGINPCGFSKQTMISMQELLNQTIDKSQLADRFYNFWLESFR
jgi:lipoate-protein ligase B